MSEILHQLAWGDEGKTVLTRNAFDQHRQTQRNEMGKRSCLSSNELTFTVECDTVPCV